MRMPVAQDRVPGVTGYIEMIMRFAYWYERQHSTPSIEAVCDTFHVSRATAYRWRNAGRTAMGAPTA